MSVFGEVGVYSQNDDWLVAGVAICIVYLIIYPLFIIHLRNRHSKRIRKHLVTSAYKLSVSLTPTEFAYVFSPKVGSNQLYATLLDLANRSLLVLEKKDKVTVARIGPKEDDKLQSFELFLIDKIKKSDKPVPIEKLTTGMDSISLSGIGKISGKKSYVYWWLQRQSLRDRKIIEKRMTGRYGVMLFKFGAVGGLIVSVIPLVSYRFMQMLNSGEVDVESLLQNAKSGLLFWIIALIPIVVISFFLLRFRGKMLGRSWLLTSNFKRYLGQLDAFREYVRLSHKEKLRFESKELKKESIARTRPYAIACGYIKP